jgi:predicted GNAT superfamily acetyltransferase
MTIRPYKSSDLPALYAINQQSVPGVGHEDRAEGLARWIDISTCLVAVDQDDEPLGFITLIAPGTLAYESQNLRWFETWLEDRNTSLIYVDRIALAETARGQNIGEQLYNAAFAAFSGTDQIGCEVNTAPDNPGSHRFHQRLGFKQVGERQHDEGRKGVAYYVRSI